MTKYQEILARAQWEAEQNRSWDWQDVVVMAGSAVVALVAILMMFSPFIGG